MDMLGIYSIVDNCDGSDPIWEKTGEW